VTDAKRIPDKAFILAAGMGKRLAPHTDTKPKPMVEVAGRAMIDRTIDELEKIGVKDITVNVHYRAGQLQQHLASRKVPRLTFSFESALLDTAGGIKKALFTMGSQPFYVFSGDTVWEDGPSGNTLKRLGEAWDDATMDLLLLLQPLDAMPVTEGSGDYNLDANGKPVLTFDKSGKYFWPSIRIVHPRLFDNTPPINTPFSFLDLMQKAEKSGRLAAIVHDGTCYHISRPADLDAVNQHLQGAVKPQTPGPKTP
jgi:MurNAc alpha-1-phosphate uridylyltransferase